MKSTRKFRSAPRGILRQRGVALFFALVALVAMSLAAVALIRSVDTSTLIAGNLAFKQSATTAGDAGIEAAIRWLTKAEAGSSTRFLNDPNHPFNQNGGSGSFKNKGYYPQVDFNPTDGTRIRWDDNDSELVVTDAADNTDAAGNRVRYIIQRMCRFPFPTPPETWKSNCLFSDAIEDNNGHQVRLPQEICQGDGCPAAGQFPVMRITSRIEGPRNAVSYVQAFVY